MRPLELIEQKLNNTNLDEVADILKAKEPYIFVNTHFKRKKKRMVSLEQVVIKIAKAYSLEKSEKEKLASVSNMVKLHFKWRNGKIPLWGKIKNYIYVDVEGKCIFLNCLGDVVEKDEIFYKTDTKMSKNKVILLI